MAAGNTLFKKRESNVVTDEFGKKKNSRLFGKEKSKVVFERYKSLTK